MGKLLVSIRFRWRMAEEGVVQILGGIASKEFQSAFAGEWLKKSVFGDKVVAVNYLNQIFLRKFSALKVK